MTEAETELLEKLDARVHRLEVELYGDEEAREVYQQAKATNTCPNIDEPGPGFIATMGEIAVAFSEILDKFDVNLPTKVAKLDDRITAFLAEQPASKIFVDTAINRLNGALREHFGKIFDGAIENAVRANNRIDSVWNTLTGWKRFEDEVAHPKPKLSRFESLLHAVTGRAPNGKH